MLVEELSFSYADSACVDLSIRFYFVRICSRLALFVYCKERAYQFNGSKHC